MVIRGEGISSFELDGHPHRNSVKSIESFEEWGSSQIRKIEDSFSIPILIVEAHGSHGNYASTLSEKIPPHLIVENNLGKKQMITPEVFDKKMLEIRASLGCYFYIFFKSCYSLEFVKELYETHNAQSYCHGFLSWMQQLDSRGSHIVHEPLKEIFRYYHDCKSTNNETRFLDLLQTQLKRSTSPTVGESQRTLRRLSPSSSVPKEYEKQPLAHFMGPQDTSNPAAYMFSSRSGPYENEHFFNDKRIIGELAVTVVFRRKYRTYFFDGQTLSRQEKDRAPTSVEEQE